MFFCFLFALASAFSFPYSSRNTPCHDTSYAFYTHLTHLEFLGHPGSAFFLRVFHPHLSPPEKGFHVVGFLPLILAFLHLSELGVFVFIPGSGQWGRGLWVPCSLFGELSLELHYILFPGLGTHSFVYCSLAFIFRCSQFTSYYNT